MKGQYIQFFTTSKKNPNFPMLIEDAGKTKSLDGRLSLDSCCEIAVGLCREYGHKGFRIMIEKEVKHPEGDYRTWHYLTECWKVFPDKVEF